MTMQIAAAAAGEGGSNGFHWFSQRLDHGHRRGGGGTGNARVRPLPAGDPFCRADDRRAAPARPSTGRGRVDRDDPRRAVARNPNCRSRNPSPRALLRTQGRSPEGHRSHRKRRFAPPRVPRRRGGRTAIMNRATKGPAVNEPDYLADRFEAQRNHLRAVAYRMLGSLSEADDAVQEAWMRLNRT